MRVSRENRTAAAVSANSEYDEGRLMRNTVSSPVLRPIVAIVTLLSLIGPGLPASDTVATDADLVAKALSVSPGYTTPVVTANGEPIFVVRDLNGDGRLDVTLLATVVHPQVESTVEALGDSLRLYARDVTEPVFILETYFAGQEAITTVELGRRTVWTGLRIVDLSREALPVAASLTFRTRAGMETELVVFHPGGGISRFAFEESRNRKGAIVDLNQDGRLDVVTALRAPESGRGYETFIEIHELGPDGFERTDSMPLVRTVNTFLEEAASAMERQQWVRVAGLVRSAPGTTVANTLAAAFVGVPDEEIPRTRFDYPTRAIQVRSVTFPRLADNPFPEPYLGRSFRFVFRVESGERTPRFFEATIGLSENPFAERPLAFLTDGESGK